MLLEEGGEFDVEGVRVFQIGEMTGAGKDRDSAPGMRAAMRSIMAAGALLSFSPASTSVGQEIAPSVSRSQM